MKVYHLAYDKSAASVNIHFWTKCSFNCHSCYVPYNHLDFGLFDDPLSIMYGDKIKKPDQQFLSVIHVMELLQPHVIKSAVFMGTEPSLDTEMPKLAKLLHIEHGSYNILLTNGYYLPDISHINEIIISIKAMTPSIHQNYTGKSNQLVLDNFKSIYASGTKVQVETVFIPGLIDEVEIENIANFIAKTDENIPLRIDAYFPVGNSEWPAAENIQVQKAAENARRYLKNVNCLTLDMKRIGEKSVRLY